MKQIKVIISDHHSMMRDALAEALERRMKNICIVETVTDGIKCVELLRERNVDIIITDITEKSDGIRILEYIKEARRTESVIILTDSAAREPLDMVLEFQVRGYILTTSSLEELEEGILCAAKGKCYIDKNMREMTKNTAQPECQEKNVDVTAILTKREVEILKLLTGGLLNKEIAYKLSISEKTVKNHISNIFKKTGVSDRTQAAVYAIKNKVVSV